MSFLDFTGLSHFYDNIKSRFIRSVNSITPDANGNVEITHVAAADNLVSEDSQILADTFIMRSSGGAASIETGNASLLCIKGNIDIQGRVEENMTINTTNDLEVTCDLSIWRTMVNSNVTYKFDYIRPDPPKNPSVASWSADGTWYWYNTVNTVTLSSYGLDPINLVSPSISIATNAGSGNSAIVSPWGWMTYVQNSGTYIFIYDANAVTLDKWKLNGNPVSLSDFSISYSGTPNDQDTVTVVYEAGTPNGVLTVNYIAPNLGTIIPTNPTSFISTGINQFDADTMMFPGSIEENQYSSTNGIIHMSTGSGIIPEWICYCKVVGGTNGYTIKSDNEVEYAGWTDTLPQEGTLITLKNFVEDESKTLFHMQAAEGQYIVIQLGRLGPLSNLTIHPTWSGIDDSISAPYTVSTITLPTRDYNNNPLPLGDYGMPRVGVVADELYLETKQYIQRIGKDSVANMESIIALDTDYIYDNEFIYYVLPSSINYTLPDLEYVYLVNDYGTEQFIFNSGVTPVAAYAQIAYGNNLIDKLRTDVLTISKQNLSNEQLQQVYENLSLYELFSYVPGQTEANTVPMVLNGYVTGGKKVIVLDYITQKSMKNISNIYISSITGRVRSHTGGINNGYVNGSDNDDYDWTSVATIETEKVNDYHFTIKIRSSTAYTNVTNNEPVSAWLKLGIQYTARINVVPNFEGITVVSNG